MSTMDCYVFDLDGTLFDSTWRQHHLQGIEGPDWDAFYAACEDDPIVPALVQLAATLWLADKTVIFATGRPASVYTQTKNSLVKAFAQYSATLMPIVYMRRDGDRRADYLVKSEMLAVIRKDGWNPIMAFEDRARLVRMWRDAGVPCMHVREETY